MSWKVAHASGDRRSRAVFCCFVALGAGVTVSVAAGVGEGGSGGGGTRWIHAAGGTIVGFLEESGLSR